MQYSGVCIFHKHTNLLPYFYSKYHDGDFTSKERYDKCKARYEAERDVQLILLVRYEGGKMICRIKCPINPMPIRGEFVPSDILSVFEFLRQQGWEHKDTFNLNMFR